MDILNAGLFYIKNDLEMSFVSDFQAFNFVFYLENVVN